MKDGTLPLEDLYFELDHLDNAEYIITQTIKRCADVLGNMAANEPDKQMQRRTCLAETAHRLRLVSGTK